MDGEIMTKEEEASKTLTQYIDYDAETPDYYEMEKACKVAIKALEQEPILDKIRAEINSPNRGTCDYFIVDRIEEIIDKYKTESEEQE